MRTEQNHRSTARQLDKINQQFSGRMQRMPYDWLQAHAQGHRGATPVEAWRSKYFLAVLFDEPGQPYQRLTVNRCAIDTRTGGWADGIPWDELQRIKSEIGLGDRWAIEVFPPDDRVVNVAAMRHLWVFPAGETPGYGWNFSSAQEKS